MTAGHPFSWLRPAPAWLRGLLVCVPVYIIWLATYPVRTALPRLIEIGFLTVMQTAVARTLWRASSRPDFPQGYRQASRWLVLAWVVQVLASATLPVFSVQPDVASLGPPDLLYITAYPLTFIGLTRLPKAAPPLPGLWRVLLDSAAFIVGVGVPIWFFAIQPTLLKAHNLSTLLTISYPALAFIGVMILNSVLLRAMPFPSHRGLNLILAALGVSWMADIMFAIQLTQFGAVRGLGYWVNITNTFSLALALLGSWRLQSDPPPPHTLRPATVSPVPVLTIVLVSLLLIPGIFQGGLDLMTLRKLVVGVLLLVVVLLLRETLALGETSRQAVDAATARVQARFEVLVRHSSDLVLVLDGQGLITFASPAAARVTGFKSEAVTGRQLIELLHPEDVATTQAFLEALLHGSKPSIHQCRVRHQDASWRIIEISGSNLLEDQAVQGIVLNARDITERHRLEDQLREAQKMEAVGRLAGGVAHDFNNLLSAILGNAELAETHLAEGHPAALDLKRIYGAATRGAVLTGRLLAFCRRELPESRTLDPAQLVWGVKPLLEGLLGERVGLDLDLDPQAWPITIDPNGLEQALLNLAANARDAMPEGGRLTLRLQNSNFAEARVTPYLSITAGDAVVLDVVDSGSGMDGSTLKHLFEPFFTTKIRGKGTGLGLASVYGLLKACGGGIDVQSKPGQGTTIRLVFPRATAAPTEEDQVSGPYPARGFETILLVEDEPSVRDSTQRLLNASGYVVLAAGNAKEAWAIFQERAGEIHLLLTDVIMPGDSGPTLAAELVAAHPSLRVLYISGYTADELGPHGLARPDAPLLRKPFTAGQLTQRLRAVLSGPAGQI